MNIMDVYSAQIGAILSANEPAFNDKPIDKVMRL